MARSNQNPPAPPPKRLLSPDEIGRGITRLQDRIGELEAFNISTVPKGNSPELTALSAAIRDTLDRCFGERSSAYGRFVGAATLQFRAIAFSSNYPLQHHYQEGAQNHIARSVALLQEAQRTLREDLIDATHVLPSTPTTSHVVSKLSNKVFVVHGHDEGARETIARFLDKIGFDPVILHEQANQGRTIIEKVEAHGDVGFAVVLFTGDDEGRIRDTTEPLRPRARQNVVLELGYFIGRLGRDRVCALKRGDVELPSDFAGVVWETMDAGSGWKQALGRELEAAGHSIDWNKVMGR